MASNTELNQRMQELWKRYLPQQLSRLETISRAVEALEAGELNSEMRSHAAADAHKLAGSLGTFGLHEASEIAEEIEVTLSSDAVVNGEITSRLATAVASLRSQIDDKQ